MGQRYDNARNMGGAHKDIQACVSNEISYETIHISSTAYTWNFFVERLSHRSIEYSSSSMLLQE